MTLDNIPGPNVFAQRDVRETPASTATATAVGLTDLNYILISTDADTTRDRVIIAGEGIDFDDAGAKSTFTIKGEDASTTNKGIARFDATDFDTAAGVVTIDDSGVDHNLTGNYTVTQHRVWENSIAQNIHADNYTDTGDTTAHASFSQLDFASAGHTGFAAALGADDNYVTDAEKIVIGNTSGSNTGDQDTTYTADEAGITLSTTEFQLKNKTSYWTCAGSNFLVKTVDTFTLVGGSAVITNGSGSDADFFAPVLIPHGAVITSCIIYGNDSTDTWDLRRCLLTDATSDSMANAAVNTSNSSITNATINNATYFYILRGIIANTKAIYGAKITYTTDYI